MKHGANIICSTVQSGAENSNGKEGGREGGRGRTGNSRPSLEVRNIFTVHEERFTTSYERGVSGRRLRVAREGLHGSGRLGGGATVVVACSGSAHTLSGQWIYRTRPLQAKSA